MIVDIKLNLWYHSCMLNRNTKINDTLTDNDYALATYQYNFDIALDNAKTRPYGFIESYQKPVYRDGQKCRKKYTLKKTATNCWTVIEIKVTD